MASEAVGRLEEHGDDCVIKFPLEWANSHGLEVGDVVEVTFIAGPKGGPHQVIITKLV